MLYPLSVICILVFQATNAVALSIDEATYLQFSCRVTFMTITNICTAKPQLLKN